MLPGFGAGAQATAAQRHEAMRHLDERMARLPSGLLMYFPKGARPLSMGRLLGIEFAAELLEAFLVVYLLSLTRLNSFGGRLGFVSVAGVLVAFTTNISYWNWYGFPTSYTAAYMFTQFVGFLVVGLVAAFFGRERATARP